MEGINMVAFFVGMAVMAILMIASFEYKASTGIVEFGSHRFVLPKECEPCENINKGFYVRECSLNIDPAGFYLSQSGLICNSLQNNCLSAIENGYNCQWFKESKICSCRIT